MKYKISGVNKINDKQINNEVFESVGYFITERDNQIDILFDMIGDIKRNDRELIKEDILYLSSLDNIYILSSNSTNEYLTEEESQEILKELYECKI